MTARGPSFGQMFGGEAAAPQLKPPENQQRAAICPIHPRSRILWQNSALSIQILSLYISPSSQAKMQRPSYNNPPPAHSPPCEYNSLVYLGTPLLGILSDDL